MRRTSAKALTAAAGALLITATACTTAPNAPTRANIVMGDGRDRTASRTVSDWVTYADHVLVVTVVNEIRRAPSRTETERGEGMIGRIANLRVDRVLWSAPDAPQPAPSTLDASAAGWVFNDNNGSGTEEFALRHTSRLEIGHTYVKAIEWIDDPCADDPNQGRWEGLGSGGIIPFDGGVLGAGEFEGRVQTLDEARAQWQTHDPGSPGVRTQMAGQPVGTLVASMRATPPRLERNNGPAECDPADR